MRSRGIWSVTYRIEGAPCDRLDDPSTITALLKDTADLARLTVVAAVEHRFAPQGVSAVLVLSESHVAIHSWPETGTAYLTLTSCRQIGSGVIDAIGSCAARLLGARTITHARVEL